MATLTDRQAFVVAGLACFALYLCGLIISIIRARRTDKHRIAKLGKPSTDGKITPQAVVGLVRDITSPILKDRESSADEAGYWASDNYFRSSDELMLAAIHVWAAQNEYDLSVRRDLLDSFVVLTLGEPGPVDLIETVVREFGGSDFWDSGEGMSDLALRVGSVKGMGARGAPGDRSVRGVGYLGMLALVRGLVSYSADERRFWCGRISQWVWEFNEREAATVARLLAATIEIESGDVDTVRPQFAITHSLLIKEFDLE